VNLSTIEMPADEARVAFRDYRNALRHRQHEQRWELEETMRKEDALVVRTYRQLSMGKRLIMLSETLRAGGADDLGRPKLAVARADQRTARLVPQYGVGGHSTPRVWYICGEDATVESRYHFEHSRTYCHPLWRSPDNAKQAVAVVPLIPAPLRPDANLANYHILWEAEWKHVAPRDPALLKHLGGDLYAVVAVWDLTEVERAALSIRMAGMRA
jgi:hypothetical protein